MLLAVSLIIPEHSLSDNASHVSDVARKVNGAPCLCRVALRRLTVARSVFSI